MALVKEVLLAFRPKTLTAAFVPCLAATCLAVGLQKTVSWTLFTYALFSAFLIQIGTNLVNDSVDFSKGADTAERIGPRRITASGVLKPRQTMMIATVALALAIILGIPLVLKGGLPIVILGLVSVAMAYSYTAGPFPLAYLGLGDLFVIFFFGIFAVSGLYYIQTGELRMDAVVLGLQVGLHATVLIAINNLRDSAGDVKVGKKTLAVRFGLRFSRWEIAALAFTPFVLNLWWWSQGMNRAALLPLLTLPLAFALTKNIFQREPGPEHNRFLGMAAGLHLLFGTLLSVGLIWQ